MRKISRRRFFKDSTAAVAAVAAAPYILSSSALGKNASIAPSERITLAAIGNGSRCKVVLEHFLSFNEVQCLAVCDAQKDRRIAAKAMVDEHYQNKDCVAYDDLHKIMARDDIDAVLIATGDRMHAVGSIIAAKAGKDIYSEKPMSLTIEEGRVLVETTKRYGTVYQCGHQRRSVDSYRFMTEVVQREMIGKVHTVTARAWESPVIQPQPPQPVPDGFDYDMWLGPTPYHPYTPARISAWNYLWDTGGGIMIAMNCHYTDIAQWALGRDDTGPIHYEGKAEYAENSFADIPLRAEVVCTYADGVKLILQARGAFGDRFIRFEGTKGWIQLDDATNQVTAEPESILKSRSISARGWSRTEDHIQNFLEGIKTGRETICSPEKSHRATTICHVANISLRLGRSVKWDPDSERFIDDPEADRMISRAMRPPWRL